MSSLLEGLERTFADRPDAPAVVSLVEGRVVDEIAFGGLDRASSGRARQLREAGVGPGDRVVIGLPRSRDLVEWLAGVLRLGAVAVPVDPAARPAEARHILGHSTARALVVDEAGRLAEHARGLVATILPGRAERGAGEASSEPSPPRTRPLEDGAPALLVYTSGTTGLPKGVVLSHGALAHNLRAIARSWNWTAADRLFLTLPCFHLHGLALGCLAPLLVGSSVVMADGFHAERLPADVLASRSTMFFGVPTMYARLAASQEGRPEDARGIRLWVAGSAPLAVETATRFEARFGRPVVERFGMSEALFVLSTRPGRERPGRVGWPVSGTTCRLVRSSATCPLEDCPPGEPGELLLRGPSLFSGYWNDPIATADAFVDGWFRTGDVAELEPDGCYRIVGRLSTDVIKSRGFKIGALEIEGVLLSDPAIREAAVVGLPDAELGQRVVAFVVGTGRADADPEAILERCRERLSRHKVPEEIVVVPDLPRIGPGKVDKRALQRSRAGG